MMGLDMYLDRYPKIEGLSPRDMDAIDDWHSWKEKGRDCTFEEWCGVKESDLPQKELFDLASSFRHTAFDDWDVEKRYPHTSIHDVVGYWRKANAIHKWFVDNLVDDEWEFENCEYYFVTKEHLQLLKATCKAVIDNSEVVPGKVTNGYSLDKNGKWIPEIEDGYVIKDTTVCEKFLPTQSGFFFGSTEYTEWYLDDIRRTYDMCERILRETDFEKYDLYYIASW